MSFFFVQPIKAEVIYFGKWMLFFRLFTNKASKVYHVKSYAMRRRRGPRLHITKPPNFLSFYYIYLHPTPKVFLPPTIMSKKGRKKLFWMADAELPNFLKNISLLDIRHTTAEDKRTLSIRGEKNSQIGKTFFISRPRGNFLSILVYVHIVCDYVM